MYFNKELYVNKEIKAQVKRLEKLQAIWTLVSVFAVIVIFIVIFATLSIKYEDNFIVGYAMAIFGTFVFAILICVLIPTMIRCERLKDKQTEELKGQPVYDKYVSLLQFGRRHYKINGYIAYGGVGLSLITTWILAILFPYEFYAGYAFIFPVCICNLVNAIRNRKVRQIKCMEEEIAQELRQETESADTEEV